MNALSYFLLGTATQAFSVAILQAFNFLEVTPAQQGLTGVLCLIVAAVMWKR